MQALEPVSSQALRQPVAHFWAQKLVSLGVLKEPGKLEGLEVKVVWVELVRARVEKQALAEVAGPAVPRRFEALAGLSTKSAQALALFLERR